MNYQFPTIRNISDVLPAIEGRSEFNVAVKEGYTVINYNVMFEDTFPDPNGEFKTIGSLEECNLPDFQAKVRRECRGIIFDTATGDIIRRPFHKFFNVNEREETQDRRIDMSNSHAILEKLDGSMIAPFIVNGQMIWGTKMGATDVAKPVEEFVKNNPQYIEFAEEAIHHGLTPVFEWCSRKQRIVLDYQEDQLIFTAMRNMNDGLYSSYDELVGFHNLYDIPVVRQYDSQTDMKDFLEYVRDLEDLEGFVVRFNDGHMLKLKCHWYIQIHKAKEAIMQDRNIVALILEEHLDDVKAHVPEADRDRLSLFEFDFNLEVTSICIGIVRMLECIEAGGVDRKTFALEIAPHFNQYIRSTVFSCWDDKTKVYETVRNTIRNNLTKNTKYEEIRDAWFPKVIYNA